MKTPLLALAFATACTGTAQAQSEDGLGSLRIGRASGAYLASLAKGRANMALLHYRANAETPVNPFAIAAPVSDAPLPGYEGRAGEPASWSLAASVKPLAALRLTLGYADQERGQTLALAQSTNAWVVGANYTVAVGTVLFGYGRKAPDGVAISRQLSIGYEYPLSKRSYFYADASDHKTTSTLRHIDIGIRAAF